MCADSHDEQKPGLWIFGRLSNLIPFELTALDTLSVDGDTLNSYRSLTLAEEFGGWRKIWEKDQGKDSYRDGEGSKNKENIHPSWKSSGDVADRIANKTIFN